MKSIPFPAISAGVYRYPKNEACSVAVDTVIHFMEQENYLMDVYYVLFDKENNDRYVRYVEKKEI